MMLQGREDDAVAGLEIGHAPASGHEIERGGGAGGEDDLAGLAGVEEALHPGAGPLIALRRPLGQAVHAAVHIGVVLLDEAGHGVDHGARLLGAGRRVEIDQGTAMDAAGEDREIAPHLLQIVGRSVRSSHGLACQVGDAVAFT